MNNHRLLLRNIVVFATALSLWTVWLPMMRTLSGQNSYAWGNEYFNTMYRGVGWSGDYLFLIYQAILGVTILWMGFRNPRAPFPALLVIWHAIAFANALYIPLIAGLKNVFIGDTGGIQWDLTWISPIVNGLLFLGVLIWVLWERQQTKVNTHLEWTRKNTFFCIIFGIYLVGVTILEWIGATHGITDIIAVPLNILAPSLIALMFYPWSNNSVKPDNG